MISLVWYWQQNYDVAFTSIFWGLMEGPAMIIIALSGWVIYRYRQTRAMTLAQFFEMRYSRRFRVFAGLVAFGSGIINYGIFPAVAARFFIAMCGLPDAVMIGETTIGTFPLLMGLMLGIALLFVFIGGQVAVIHLTPQPSAQPRATVGEARRSAKNAHAHSQTTCGRHCTRTLATPDSSRLM